MTPNPRSRSALWQILHLLTRLLGLTGAVAILVGLAVWFQFELARSGQIVVAAGAAAVLIALLVEARNLSAAVISSRGAVGFNSIVQNLLATTLLLV